MKNISICLWLEKDPEQVAEFYKTVFKNVKIGMISHYPESSAAVAKMRTGDVLVVDTEVEGLQIQLLNGGPMFKFSPSNSFIVTCETEAEIDEKWKQLSAGGQVRMPLDNYPWAPKYGWTTDKYGVEWQLIQASVNHKIVPSFLFVDENFGKGEAALNYYMSIFPNSKIESLTKDESGKSIMHCSFTLDGQGFALMEGTGKHGHSFNHAFSIMVNCDTQKEIDMYHDKLSAGGSVEQCGWVRDKFGVSWQIAPKMLGPLMADPKTSDRVFKAMLQMKKIDIAKIEQAAK